MYGAKTSHPVPGRPTSRPGALGPYWRTKKRRRRSDRKRQKKQRKMNTNTRLETLHGIHSRRTLTPQTKLVTSHQNLKFTDVKQITKNSRYHWQLIRGETVQNMTKQNSRTQKSGKEHQRLKPAKTMRNFPGQINERVIQIEEKGWPQVQDQYREPNRGKNSQWGGKAVSDKSNKEADLVVMDRTRQNSIPESTTQTKKLHHNMVSP